jgi:hypothetical protein
MKKIMVRKFEMQIGDKGITVVDHRHKPPRKCGTLTWKNIMDIIEREFTSPEIHPCGPMF